MFLAVKEIENQSSHVMGYLCESADTKPSSNIPVGAILTETDTKTTYIYNGLSWIALSPTNVNLSTALSKDFDSIDVAKMSKSSIITAHNAISSTATSTEISSVGYNAILLHVVITGTGTWEASITSSPTSGGTFVDTYDGTTKVSTGGLTESRCVLLRGITDYVKVVATELVNGATCTVKVQLLNL